MKDKTKVLERLYSKIRRRTKYNVYAWSIYLLSGARQRFHSYIDWKSFALGIGFTTTNRICGWKYMFSMDLGFFSFWIYFVKC